MPTEQGAGKREEAAVLERARDFRRNWRNRDEHAWGDSEVAAFALSEIALAKRETMKECAQIAGGWTGEINTVENCTVVSEVCRQIAAAIRRKMAEMGEK